MQTHCKLCGAEIPADDTDAESLAATCASCQEAVGAAGQRDGSSALYRGGPARPPVGLRLEGDVLDIPWPASSLGGLNRTHLVISSDEVKVETRGPIRRADRVIPIAAIDQLFCSGGSSDGPDGATYSVTAMRKSAPERTLLASVLSALVKRDREITLISDLFHDQALYVERELEKRMGIADRPVFGETPRERPRARRKADSSAPAVSGSVDQTAAGADTVAERPPAHTPRNTTAERDGADLTITWRWFKLLYLAAVAFAIVWNAGVMGFWQTALSPGTSLVDRLPALPFVAAGVFLVYVALTGLLNSTRLTANDDRLTVRHGPIPAPGGRTIRTSDIRQLFCTKRTRHSRNAHPVTTYRVRVTLKDGRTRTLLWALDDFDRALFIEEQIEKHLGIEDRHVRGSVRG